MNRDDYARWYTQEFDEVYREAVKESSLFDEHVAKLSLGDEYHQRAKASYFKTIKVLASLSNRFFKKVEGREAADWTSKEKDQYARINGLARTLGEVLNKLHAARKLSSAS